MNLSFQVFDKAGSSLKGPVALNVDDLKRLVQEVARVDGNDVTVPAGQKKGADDQ